MIDLKAIKARCEAAAKGPWYENFSIQSGSQIVAADSPICLIQEGCTERGYANMLFLSGARSDLPDCIAEIERLQGLLKVAKCPNCDGSGAMPHQVADGEWEAEQCQWCDETKGLKE